MIVSQGNNRPQDKLCLRGCRNGYPVLHRSTLMTLAAGDGTGQTQLVVTDTQVRVCLCVFACVGGWMLACLDGWVCTHVCVYVRAHT